MKIYIGTDHAGYELKEKLKIYLSELGHEVEDKGAVEFTPNDDYPDFIVPVAQAVSQDSQSLGIVLGASGQGEAMCANRTSGVRAAVFYGQMIPKDAIDTAGRESKDPYEIVKLARFHNDANILSIGAHFVLEDEAEHAVKIFTETLFSGDERHQRRIAKF